MNRHLMSLMTALGGLAAAPAVAQIQPMGVPAARPVANQPRATVPISRPPPTAKTGTPATAKTGTPAKAGPDALAPTNPDFKADQTVAQPAPIPVLLPPAMWDVVNAEDLLRTIGEVDKEGLNPADYDPAGLQAA